MINRRNFLRNLSLLTLGGLASRETTFANSTKSIAGVDAVSTATAASIDGQIGLQTYSLGQELLKDIPAGLKRLKKAGYTHLEIFGYRPDTGKFGDYNPNNTNFIGAKEYKKMVDDAGLRISSSHLSPYSLKEYTKENLPKFEEFWKKATDVHAELGVSCMVQPSMPTVNNEDDAKRVCEIFNRVGEITKQAGILWGYHNHHNEFRRVLKDSTKPSDLNPWDRKGTCIEQLFLENTDPENVMFELDVYWTVMGQQDPVEWLEKYPNRIKLLHIKDRWIIGDSGMMNFENIFNQAYKNGILGFYVELESDRKGRTQFEGVEKSAKFLRNAKFVR